MNAGWARRLALLTAAAFALATAPAAAEPEGAYCSIFAVYGDECVGGLHTLTRSSTFSADGLYVAAGAYTSGGAPYASLVYATTYACHPYGAGTSLRGRSRDSDTSHSGVLAGSEYWTGTSC
jgi:hypothetical protein